MRIRIPRRFLLLGILLCSLALAASVPQPVHAKPIPWNDENGPSPGDGDGPVVKGTGASLSSGATLLRSYEGTARVTRTTTTGSIWKTYLMTLRLGYGWRWIW
jgi:hypothetical protein